MSTQPITPELYKLSAVAEESQKIGEFLDWMESRHYQICGWINGNSDEHGHYSPIRLSDEQLFAQYFNIDLQKVEQEKQALLAWLREEHE